MFEQDFFSPMRDQNIQRKKCDDALCLNTIFLAQWKIKIYKGKNVMILYVW
jgi:hypothetical protein